MQWCATGPNALSSSVSSMRSSSSSFRLPWQSHSLSTDLCLQLADGSADVLRMSTELKLRGCLHTSQRV
eukprot:6117930-Amphidinium_carterae.1